MLKVDYIEQSGETLIFTHDFFQDCLSEWFKGSEIEIDKAQYIPPKRESLEFGPKVMKDQTHPIGVQQYRLTFKKDGKKEKVDLITKSKISDDQYLRMISDAFERCDIHPKEKRVIEYLGELEFSNLNKKEVAIYKMQKMDERFAQNLPYCYGTYFNPTEGVCVLILQYLKDEWLSLNPLDISKWREPQTETLIRAQAEIHAVWYGKENQIKQINGFKNVADMAKMLRFSDYWEALVQAAGFEDPFLDQLIKTIADWYLPIENGPKTLVQNDCVPKNVALNKVGNRYKAYVYDWEIATIHLPQRDTAEFLCYVLPENFSIDLLNHYVHLHREVLSKEIGQPLHQKQWERGYCAATRDYLLQRILPQLPFEKLEERNALKLYRNARRMIELYDKN